MDLAELIRGIQSKLPRALGPNVPIPLPSDRRQGCRGCPAAIAARVEAREGSNRGLDALLKTSHPVSVRCTDLAGELLGDWVRDTSALAEACRAKVRRELVHLYGGDAAAASRELKIDSAISQVTERTQADALLGGAEVAI